MKTLAQGAQDMKRLADEYKAFDRNIPKYAGTAAVKYFKHNFDPDVQGFREEKGKITKWKARDKKTNYAYDNYKTYKGGQYSGSHLILRQSGNLRDSIDFKVEGDHKIWVGVNGNKLGENHKNGIGFAQAINEGLGHQPKRQFIGWSKGLAEAIHKDIVRRRAKIFKNFQK